MIEFSSALIGLAVSLGIAILGAEIGLWGGRWLLRRAHERIGGWRTRRACARASAQQRCRVR